MQHAVKFSRKLLRVEYSSLYPCTLLSAWAGRGQVYGQESGAEDDLVDEATVAQLNTRIPEIIM